MATGDKTFKCAVVTPERAVLETEATFVALPAHDGEIGILRDRAPLLCRLDVGVLRIKGPDGDRILYVDGGFAQMVDNRLSVLTEDAREPSELDREQVTAGLAAAEDLPSITAADFKARQRAIKRARVQLGLTRSEKPGTQY